VTHIGEAGIVATSTAGAQQFGLTGLVVQAYGLHVAHRADGALV